MFPGVTAALRNRQQPDPGPFLPTRREFLGNTGKAALAIGMLPPVPHPPPASQALFPTDFAWGAATSAMQVEGYPYADGGGRSVWSVLDNDPSRVADHSNNLVAADTFHRWADDIPLMQAMGLNSYRLSIGWPRVLPEGRGTANQKALGYYDRLLDSLLKAGITPWVTVYHFDYPEALGKQGGWLHPDSPQWLADYAHLLAGRYGDRVHHWLTVNEPNIMWSLSSEAGLMPPLQKLGREQQVLGAHHILLGHGRSVQAIRAAARGPVKVGMPFAGQVSLPFTSSPSDIEAARSRTWAVVPQQLAPQLPPLLFLSNSWWLDPVYLGRYPDDGLLLLPSAEKLATPESMAAIHQPLDFCTVNLYFAPHVRAGADGRPEIVPEPATMPRTHYGWPITPELLYWGPKLFHGRYTKPIVVTENGMSWADRPSPDGRVHDAERSAFLRDYLRQYLRASQEGVPVRGYFHWSLLDNWEFTSGFAEQFGLIYVDRATLGRIVKDSAGTYGEIIRSRGATLLPG